ncbi:Disease resistance protein RPS2 [Ananas comosus]|uniref:Disease resistance protein RPS2 n=1 Tax=Ananas comosus TaxID=4615 RepID=A0A199V0A0_ANACO|nr:Disease resistance protein RPS2 [Ananas comosus]
MEFVASIIDNVFRPLKDFFARSFGYVASCMHACMQGIEIFETLRCVQVKWWLESVAALEEHAARIEEEYQERARAPPEQAAGISMWSTYQLSKLADETLAEARNWKDKGAFQKVADDLVHVRFEEMPTVPAVGMSHLLEQLRACVVGDDDVGIVGIHGMAGVGKTALLNKFHNEFLAGAADVNVAIYIEVSRDFDLDEIQKVIGDRLGLSWDRKSPKERAVVLYKVLSKMNFVLLLDDLWEPLNLRMLGVPVPKQRSRSKIILTTRIEDVCDRMDVRRKIKVDCLPWGEAWELFQEKVGEALVRSNPEIRRHAEELAAKCGGLPLALITVGRAMASKRTAKEWKHAITVLRIAPWQLLGMEGDLLRHLKHSYDNLQNDKLRTCLLYCSLFPEEFSIYKEWIIGYCIGEGFIDDLYTEMDEIYNKGHDLLGVLKTASLLERGDDEDHIKMHPMIRAMALWIASEFGAKETKWLVRAGIGLKEAPGAENWGEAERISLMRNNIHELYETPNSPSLKTLMLQGNPALERICDGFFRFMPSLRVLDLSHTSISELPSGLSALSGLQYLDLYNTNIRSLPQELGALVNLRFLLLSNMPLATIASGVIGSLAMLQVLYMDLSYGDWKVGTAGTGVELQELEGLRRLKALDITIQTVDALQRLSRSHRLAGSMRNLLMKGCGGLTRIQLPSSDLWRNMNGLKRVWIVGCGDLEEVVIDGSKDGDEMPALPSLQSVNYQGRGSFIDDELPILPSLQSIILQGLQKAKIIYKGGCVQHLTSLDVWLCIGLEQLITFEDAVDGEADGEEPRVVAAFPALKELHLNRLPNFKSFSDGRTLLAFPALEKLTIVECPKLKKIELDARELQEIRCSLEWWDGLVWGDEEVKSYFAPLVRQILC